MGAAACQCHPARRALELQPGFSGHGVSLNGITLRYGHLAHLEDRRTESVFAELAKLRGPNCITLQANFARIKMSMQTILNTERDFATTRRTSQPASERTRTRCRTPTASPRRLKQTRSAQEVLRAWLREIACQKDKLLCKCFFVAWNSCGVRLPVRAVKSASALGRMQNGRASIGE